MPFRVAASIYFTSGSAAQDQQSASLTSSRKALPLLTRISLSQPTLFRTAKADVAPLISFGPQKSGRSRRRPGSPGIRGPLSWPTGAYRTWCPDHWRAPPGPRPPSPGQWPSWPPRAAPGRRCPGQSTTAAAFRVVRSVAIVFSFCLMIPVLAPGILVLIKQYQCQEHECHLHKN